MRLFAGVLLMLALPCSASAATITRKSDGVSTTLTYTAAQGETNAVTVKVDPEARKTTFTDLGATITAPAACTTADMVVTCPSTDTVGLEVSLGDGDDSFTDESDPAELGIFFRSISGGPGNDTLDAAADRITGGEGDDTLTGAAFDSEFLGGPGADTLRGRGDAQELNGGPGIDAIDGGKETQQEVSYAGETRPVIVDLNQTTMGPAGEEDTVTNVSGIIGGEGDDTLTGNTDWNVIEGGDGDDTITGGHGQDRIAPGRGADQVDAGAGKDTIVEARGEMTPEAVLDGGAGPDEILARKSAAAVLGGGGDDRLRFDADNVRVDGGPGNDAVRDDNSLESSENVTCGTGDDIASQFGKAVVPSDCEKIEFFSSKTQIYIDNALTLDAGGLEVEVPHLCRKDCAVRVDLFSGSRRVARQEVPVAAPFRNGKATFVLSAAQRRTFEKAGEVTFFFTPVGVSDIDAAFATIGLP